MAELTERERRVLGMVIEDGRTTREVATALHISHAAARSAYRSIIAKLERENCVALSRWERRQ
jgi:DNA-binding CsgD family transcriptional regulator